METGARVLPHFMKDNTDRNRTSPFAFTGNKFEFRMPGSSLSAAGPNVILNTAVAEELRRFSEELSTVAPEKLHSAAKDLVRRTVEAHKRILFNGNGYTDEWVEEAERRGLWNLVSTPDAIPHFLDEKNVELFTRHHIFSPEEIHARYEIMLENYSKALQLEGRTMVEMMEKDLLPALLTHTGDTATAVGAKQAMGLSTGCDKELLQELSSLYESITVNTKALTANLAAVSSITDVLETARFCHDSILANLETIRSFADRAEALIPDRLLPYPTYDQLLFSV